MYRKNKRSAPRTRTAPHRRVTFTLSKAVPALGSQGLGDALSSCELRREQYLRCGGMHTESVKEVIRTICDGRLHTPAIAFVAPALYEGIPEFLEQTKDAMSQLAVYASLFLGLIATAGCHLLALSAQHASVPLVVCAGLYKLTPLFPSGAEQFNLMLSPQPMLQYEEGLQGVHVPNPAFDYVPPELVSLLITNIGGNHPSYIYRLLAEYYHPGDHILDGPGA